MLKRDKKKKIVAQCSVLLPTYNRENIVTVCIPNIAKQSLPPKELIVLDQGNLNKLKLSQLWNSYSTPTKLVYLKINSKGKSNALNIGVGKAKSEVIAVIDDDCYADRLWIQSLMKNIHKKKMAILTGKITAGDLEQDAVQVRDYDIKRGSHIIYKSGKFITPIFILSGANFCFKTSDFRTIGPFDISFGPGSRFRSGQDLEWCYRALSKGYSLEFIPRAIVKHRSWRNKSQDIEVMDKYGFGAGAFLQTVLNRNKFDFVYHTSNIIRWLGWETVKSIFQFKNPKPFVIYAISFIKGISST